MVQLKELLGRLKNSFFFKKEGNKKTIMVKNCFFFL